jgi:hypothetical protein
MKTVYDNKTGTAAALMIFCVFTMTALTALMLGAGAYKNVTGISGEGYDDRVCMSYIWTKVKNRDEAGSVYVSGFHGLPALRLDEEYDSVTYHTIIYPYKGWVYELFFEEGLEFSPEDGAPVIKNESLSFEQLENGLIKASVGSESVFILPRGKTGVSFAGDTGGGVK